MVILNNYEIQPTKKRTYIVTTEVHPCPTCQGVLRHRDTKPRKVIDIDGQTRTYYIRRLKCCNCGASHTELPDFIVPHKQYARRVIEMALNDANSTCTAETSTIYRWSKERSRQQNTE